MSEVSETRTNEVRSRETREAEQTQGPGDQQRDQLKGKVEGTPDPAAMRVADKITGGGGDKVEGAGGSQPITGVRPGERPELADLANRISNFRPTGSDPNADPNQAALRREITDRYTRAGDVNGAAAMHSALSDVTENPNMSDQHRREMRDYLGNFTKTDPQDIGAMRAGMTAGALARGGVRPGVREGSPGYQPPSFRDRVDAQGRPNGVREMTIGDRTYAVNSSHAYPRGHRSGVSPESTGIPRDRIESQIVQSLDRQLQAGNRPPAAPSFQDGRISIDGRSFGYRSTYLPQANEYRVTTYWVN